MQKQESSAGFMGEEGGGYCLPSFLLVVPIGQVREIWVQILTVPTFPLCGFGQEL